MALDIDGRDQRVQVDIGLSNSTKMTASASTQSGPYGHNDEVSADVFFGLEQGLVVDVPPTGDTPIAH